MREQQTLLDVKEIEKLGVTVITVPRKNNGHLRIFSNQDFRRNLFY